MSGIWGETNCNCINPHNCPCDDGTVRDQDGNILVKSIFQVSPIGQPRLRPGQVLNTDTNTIYWQDGVNLPAGHYIDSDGNQWEIYPRELTPPSYQQPVIQLPYHAPVPRQKKTIVDWDLPLNNPPLAVPTATNPRNSGSGFLDQIFNTGSNTTATQDGEGIFNNIINTVKANPLISLGVAGGLLYFFLGSGSGTYEQVTTKRRGF